MLREREAIAMKTAPQALNMLNSNTSEGIDLMISCRVTLSGSSFPIVRNPSCSARAARSVSVISLREVTSAAAAFAATWRGAKGVLARLWRPTRGRATETASERICEGN